MTQLRMRANWTELDVPFGPIRPADADGPWRLKGSPVEWWLTRA